MSLGRINGAGSPDADGLGVTHLHARAAGQHRAPGGRRAAAVGVGLALSVVAGSLLTAGSSPATAAVTTTHVQGAAAVDRGRRRATPPCTTASVHTTREQTLARLVNSERTKRGLKAYAVSASLSADRRGPGAPDVAPAERSSTTRT